MTEILLKVSHQQTLPCWTVIRVVRNVKRKQRQVTCSTRNKSRPRNQTWKKQQNIDRKENIRITEWAAHSQNVAIHPATFIELNIKCAYTWRRGTEIDTKTSIKENHNRTTKEQSAINLLVVVAVGCVARTFLSVPNPPPVSAVAQKINPLVTNGLSHSYHLDESTFIFRGIGVFFSFFFHFSTKIMSANRTAPDGTPRFAASHLGLFCLPMSHKKDYMLIWVKSVAQFA